MWNFLSDKISGIYMFKIELIQKKLKSEFGVLLKNSVAAKVLFLKTWAVVKN